MAVALSVQADKQIECIDDVDMADSLDFHAMHVECSNDPVVVYDPKSSGKLFKSKAVKTYDDAEDKALDSVSEPEVQVTESAVAQNNAGKTFIIREPFSATSGPVSAINGLFAQMISYCPSGWEKSREWVEKGTDSYFLHYQFQCFE